MVEGDERPVMADGTLYISALQLPQVDLRGTLRLSDQLFSRKAHDQRKRAFFWIIENYYFLLWLPIVVFLFRKHFPFQMTNRSADVTGGGRRSRWWWGKSKQIIDAINARIALSSDTIPYDTARKADCRNPAWWETYVRVPCAVCVA
jgi:hypothetical protein